jgi:protein-disulfide isomerase
LIGQVTVDPAVTAIRAQSQNLLILEKNGGTDLDYLLLEVLYDIAIGDAPVRGPADAPVTIVAFDDFQCPYCARLEPDLKQILDAYPDKVRLVFKNYPLSMHAHAREAAIAALAAERQGQFWPFHDRLFASSNVLSEQKIEEIAKDLKLDMARFEKDRKDSALQAKIEKDIAEGQQLGVRGTPTVFINGRLLRDRSPAAFKATVDAVLASQPAQQQ